MITIPLPESGRLDPEHYAKLVWGYFMSPASNIFDYSREIKTIPGFATMVAEGVQLYHPSLRLEDELPLTKYIRCKGAH